MGNEIKCPGNIAVLRVEDTLPYEEITLSLSVETTTQFHPVIVLHFEKLPIFDIKERLLGVIMIK
ncbi:MAG: hypothetical protein ACK5L7_02550 [Paludibacteraceae bacterium]